MTEYQQTKWSLQDLFPGADSPELDAAFTDIKTKVEAFALVRPRLSGDISSEDFLDLVRQYEEITRLAYCLGGYSGLLFSEDTRNPAAVTLLQKVDQFLAGLMNQTLFFNLWWKDLSDAAADRLMADSGDYRYWLEEIRHFKPHTLSEPEEKIVNIKNVTGSSALNTLYSSITNRYIFKLEVDGEVREMTRGELMVYVRQADPDVRARAYQELYRVYSQDAPILGQIYQYLARDWHAENLGLRNYTQAIAPRNLSNDLPDEVVDTLLEVARKNVGIFQRFFQLKARLIGMERLRRYDLYAPVSSADKFYSFNEGTELVFDAYRQFDPRLEEMVRRVPDQNHLDSSIRKGKRGGAFCSTVLPELTPWVLLNYQGRVDDVSTMAHELGHAVHSMLASHHSNLTQHACLPLAETASTFGEMLLVDKLLAVETDPSVRQDILFAQVDGSYATIQRQVYFALFEKQAHAMVQEDASVDELADAYLLNLKEQFGESMEVNPEFKWEWICVPHFYEVPFYVYAYAFGQLLVLSLYEQYRQEGDAFKPRYFKILSTGGAEAPVKLLSSVGVDVSRAEFWQGGFNVIDKMVKQLEAME